MLEITKSVFLSNIPELRDRKDKIVLEAAMSASVDVIVSGEFWRIIQSFGDRILS